DAAGAAPCTLIVPTASPTLTTSPSLMPSAVMVPAAGDGISIDALSDSTVNSDCSAVTTSPTLTSISMTATSLKSPMSGMTIFIELAAAAGAAGAGAAAVSACF